MILVRSPLRISFVGGGSDVPSHFEKYGGAVLSATIDKYIYITAKQQTGLFPHKFRLVYSKVEEVDRVEDIQHPIIREIVSDYGMKSLDLDVMSDIPAGTGMGSSSAFTVGLLKAIRHLDPNRITEWDKDKHQYAATACHYEIEMLHEPIGKQDQYAAAYGGLNYFQFSTERTQITPIALDSFETGSLENRLHLIYIGGSRSASALLKEQFSRDNSEDLCAMAELAKDGAIALRKGDIESLGPIILEGWERKKRLSPNVSNAKIDTIIDTALANGATGGKLLGAGGAGFVLLFCPRHNQDKMLNALKPLNLTYVPFNLEFEGAKVLYEDV